MGYEGIIAHTAEPARAIMGYEGIIAHTVFV
jgi:hypothetical protein